MNLLKPDYGNFASLIPQQVAPRTTIKPNDYSGVSAILLAMGAKADEAKKKAADEALATQGLEAATKYMSAMDEMNRYDPMAAEKEAIGKLSRMPIIVDAEGNKDYSAPRASVEVGINEPAPDVTSPLLELVRAGQLSPTDSPIRKLADAAREDNTVRLNTEKAYKTFTDAGLSPQMASILAIPAGQGKGGAGTANALNILSLPLETQAKMGLLEKESELNKIENEQKFGQQKALTEFESNLKLKSDLATLHAKEIADRNKADYEAKVAEGKTPVLKPMTETAIREKIQMDRLAGDLEALRSRFNALDSYKRNPASGRALGFTKDFDAERALIENDLTGLVNGVGKGLYGELRLTDSDVNLYKGILPSINQTPAVANKLIDSLIKKTMQAKEYARTGYANAGYDTSLYDGRKPSAPSVPSTQPTTANDKLKRLKELAAGGNNSAQNTLKSMGETW